MIVFVVNSHRQCTAHVTPPSMAADFASALSSNNVADNVHAHNDHRKGIVTFTLPSHVNRHYELKPVLENVGRLVTSNGHEATMVFA